MIRRREFITLLGGATLACPLAARAQQPPMPVIGFLQRSKPVRTDFADFRDGLKALGYEDGRNIRIEQRYAGLDIDVLRAFAQELVGMNVKVIVIDGFATIHTVMAATKTIPIVSALIAGPDQFGIASLARPGGNLTGLSVSTDDLGGKRLERGSRGRHMAWRFRSDCRISTGCFVAADQRDIRKQPYKTGSACGRAALTGGVRRARICRRWGLDVVRHKLF
jgi:hypothetical protein